MKRLVALHAQRIALVYIGPDTKSVRQFAPDPLTQLGLIAGPQKQVDAMLESIRPLQWHGPWYAATPPLIELCRAKQPGVLAHRQADATDLTSETLVTLGAAKKHPAIKRSYRVLRRYARRGVKHRRTGEFIRLETCIMPAGESTSVEAWRRFTSALQ